MKPITLKNIAAIENLTIPIPADGGVVVLQGRNGSGKSTALDAVQTAMTGKGKPTLRDRASKGEIHAGGVTLSIAKSVRKTGTLEVSVLDSRLSIADLVDPGIIDPIRADASRIKALVSLSGEEIEAEDLYGFPENLTTGLNLADPVGAMAELKKRLDTGGREYEKLASEEQAKATGLRELVGELLSDPGEINSEVLQGRITEALRKLDRLQSENELADNARQRAQQARERLKDITVPDVVVLKARVAQLATDMESTQQKAQKLKEQYNATVNEFKDLSAQKGIADAQLESANEQLKLRGQLEQQIAESEKSRPDDAAFNVAQQNLENAQRALDAARKFNDQRKIIDQADAAQRQADEYLDESRALRHKAKQTEDLLTEIVAALPGCPLKIRDSRLVIDTTRGPTFFSELSEGERWRVSLDIAISVIDQNGLIVIPQAAWEGLDPINQQAIAEQAKSARVVVLTAKCDDGKLTARAFESAA